MFKKVEKGYILYKKGIICDNVKSVNIKKRISVILSTTILMTFN